MFGTVSIIYSCFYGCQVLTELRRRRPRASLDSFHTPTLVEIPIFS